MSLTGRKLDYPYITSNPGIAGGRPVIEGTRITVNCIAGYYQIVLTLFVLFHGIGQKVIKIKRYLG